MDQTAWLGIALIVAIGVATVALERVIERREAHSAWGEFLRRDTSGRTLFIPYGDVGYVIRDPLAIRRAERLCARGFGLLESGSLCFGALILVFVAFEWHSHIATVALAAVAGWAAVIAWAVREVRSIASGLPRAA